MDTLISPQTHDFTKNFLPVAAGGAGFCLQRAVNFGGDFGPEILEFFAHILLSKKCHAPYCRHGQPLTSEELRLRVMADSRGRANPACQRIENGFASCGLLSGVQAKQVRPQILDMAQPGVRDYSGRFPQTQRGCCAIKPGGTVFIPAQLVDDVLDGFAFCHVEKIISILP